MVVMSIALLAVITGIVLTSAKYYKLSKYATDDTNNVMRENILGVRVVKSFNLQEDQIRRFEIVNERLRKVTEKGYVIGMYLFPIINFVMSSAIAVVL